ncbi:unnamed protein product [Amoebophrya sp. A120]|nr:unnamed protein product [Amoebophrya sp. A120]|eukprot:GSA120T00018718001.1
MFFHMRIFCAVATGFFSFFCAAATVGSSGVRTARSRSRSPHFGPVELGAVRARAPGDEAEIPLPFAATSATLARGTFSPSQDQSTRCGVRSDVVVGDDPRPQPYIFRIRVSPMGDWIERDNHKRVWDLQAAFHELTCVCTLSPCAASSGRAGDTTPGGRSVAPPQPGGHQDPPARMYKLCSSPLVIDCKLRKPQDEFIPPPGDVSNLGWNCTKMSQLRLNSTSSSIFPGVTLDRVAKLGVDEGKKVYTLPPRREGEDTDNDSEPASSPQTPDRDEEQVDSDDDRSGSGGRPRSEHATSLARAARRALKPTQVAFPLFCFSDKFLKQKPFLVSGQHGTRRIYHDQLRIYKEARFYEKHIKFEPDWININFVSRLRFPDTTTSTSGRQVPSSTTQEPCVETFVVCDGDFQLQRYHPVVSLGDPQRALLSTSSQQGASCPEEPQDDGADMEQLILRWRRFTVDPEEKNDELRWIKADLRVFLEDLRQHQNGEQNGGAPPVDCVHPDACFLHCKTETVVYAMDGWKDLYQLKSSDSVVGRTIKSICQEQRLACSDEESGSRTTTAGGSTSSSSGMEQSTCEQQQRPAAPARPSKRLRRFRPRNNRLHRIQTEPPSPIIWKSCKFCEGRSKPRTKTARRSALHWNDPEFVSTRFREEAAITAQATARFDSQNIRMPLLRGAASRSVVPRTNGGESATSSPVPAAAAPRTATTDGLFAGSAELGGERSISSAPSRSTTTSNNRDLAQRLCSIDVAIIPVACGTRTGEDPVLVCLIPLRNTLTEDARA